MKSSLQSFGVIVGFTVLKNSLDYLSAKLQRRDIYIFEAYTMIDNIKSEIQCLRDDINVEFQRWYDEAKQLASYIDTKEEMPRLPRVQCNRSNVPADAHLLHYNRSIGIPFIDMLQLQNRFSVDNCWPVSILLGPSLIVKLGVPPPEQFESWHDDLLTQGSLDNQRYPDGSICDPGSLTGLIYLIL